MIVNVVVDTMPAITFEHCPVILWDGMAEGGSRGAWRLVQLSSRPRPRLGPPPPPDVGPELLDALAHSSWGMRGPRESST